MRISIIIPAHNEEKRIGKTLEAYSNYFNGLRKNKNIDYEILVVVNASNDNTINIVKKFRSSNRRILYLNLKDGGKGYAVIEGFKNSLKRDNQLIGFTDADMATSPESFSHLVSRIEGYDGAIGSRWIKGSVVKAKQSLARKITSRGFNFIVRSLFLLPYRDTQCGAKLFTREALLSVINDIGITRWAFDVDLLYTLEKKGFKIREVPIVWADKRETKLDILIVPFEMFLGVVRLRLINSQFNFIVRFYDIFLSKFIKL